MKVGSLFAGVGGFDLGFERCGMETAWVVENDPQCQAVLRKRFPNAKVYDDVRDQYALEPVSVITGGFPCQSYSVAGGRGGLADDRGALWWEMHRIIAECRPTWIIGENVPGLLSSGEGRDFRTIIGSLVKLGYGVTWAVLDSQWFGVAQRRRRLFIVGHSGGEPRPEILALAEGMFGHPAPSREAGEGTARSVAPSLSASGRGTARAGESRGQDPLVLGVADPITASFHKHHGASAGKDSLPRNIILLFDTTQITSKVNRCRPQPGDPCHPLATGAHAPAVACPDPAYALSAGRDGRAGRRFGTGRDAQDTFVLTSNIPRRLTPLETERLQGFPDEWTQVEYRGKPMADGPRYRMMGNAVTVNVIEWIGRQIMNAEILQHEEK